MNRLIAFGHPEWPHTINIIPIAFAIDIKLFLDVSRMFPFYFCKNNVFWGNNCLFFLFFSIFAEKYVYEALVIVFFDYNVLVFVHAVLLY
jgi:hypothetical protein